MSFRFFEGVGTVHLNEAKPPRIVPTNERHKWASKPGWGESTTCTKCGCIKRRKKTKPDYTETYQMLDGSEVHERPACTESLLQKTR
jgi:hypothetical protein